MNEEKQKAENTAEDQPVDESPSSEPNEEAQAPDQTPDQTSDQTSDQSEQQPSEEKVDAQPKEQEEVKPTRAERRIRELSERLKKKDNHSQDVERLLNQNDDPLITPEDYEQGLDPKELERRVSEREQRKLQQNSQSIKEQLKAELAYEQAMNEHEKDLQSVQDSPELKENPALERMAVRLYEKENYLVDPRTGQTYFNPVVKLSEALELVKKDLSEATGTAMASAQVKVNENRETAALSPSQDAPDHQSGYDEAFDKARLSGSDQSWADVLKKRGLINVS